MSKYEKGVGGEMEQEDDYYDYEDGDLCYELNDDLLRDSELRTSYQMAVPQYESISSDLIDKEQWREADEIARNFEIPRGLSISILRSFRWDSNRLTEFWFDHMDKRESELGVYEFRSPVPETITCGVCFDDYPSKDSFLSPCGHSYCSDCIRTYVQIKTMNSGANCLSIHCPECNCIIDDSTMESLLSSAVNSTAYKIFQSHQRNAYVDRSDSRIWCINEACGHFISCKRGYTGIVQCDCGAQMCFRCSEEPHQPCTCEEARKWNIVEVQTDMDLRWIQTHTKPCPKCHEFIEKNQGCQHMTCKAPGCNYEFCWLCLGPWSEHGEQTGGFYKCKKYESLSTQHEYKQKVLEIEHDLQEIKRYENEYDSYMNFRKQKDEFLLMLPTIKGLQTKVGEKNEFTNRIILNLRTLTWSFPYAYFRTNENQFSDRNLFECQRCLLLLQTNGLTVEFRLISTILNTEPFDLNQFRTYRDAIIRKLNSSSGLSEYFTSLGVSSDHPKRP